MRNCVDKQSALIFNSVNPSRISLLTVLNLFAQPGANSTTKCCTSSFYFRGMNGNQKAIYELIKDLKPKMPASNVSNMNNTVLDLKWKQGDCGLNVQFKN